MRIYIAGKVSGIPYEMVRRDFSRAELFLNRFGNVVNPLRYCAERWGWLSCMVVCTYLLLTCRGIALMENWKDSRGARYEYKLAKFLGKEILYLEKQVVTEKVKGNTIQKVMFKFKTK